jgi:hypothetical protein
MASEESTAAAAVHQMSSQETIQNTTTIHKRQRSSDDLLLQSPRLKQLKSTSDHVPTGKRKTSDTSAVAKLFNNHHIL